MRRAGGAMAGDPRRPSGSNRRYVSRLEHSSCYFEGGVPATDSRCLRAIQGLEWHVRGAGGHNTSDGDRGVAARGACRSPVRCSDDTWASTTVDSRAASLRCPRDSHRCKRSVRGPVGPLPWRGFPSNYVSNWIRRPRDERRETIPRVSLYGPCGLRAIFVRSVPDCRRWPWRGCAIIVRETCD